MFLPWADRCRLRGNKLGSLFDSAHLHSDYSVTPQQILSVGGFAVGFFRFEMNAHKPFSICGYSFQNGLGFQRDGNSFGPGSSNRGGEHPVGWGIQRGQRSLGRRHPMEGSALRGRKNPMKPAVSWHTTLFAKSSVLYLLRPLPLERGVFASGTHHFQWLQNRRILARHGPKFRICPSGKIRLFGCRWCCGAKMILKNLRNAAASPGEREVYHTPVL